HPINRGVVPDLGWLDESGVTGLAFFALAVPVQDFFAALGEDSYREFDAPGPAPNRSQLNQPLRVKRAQIFLHLYFLPVVPVTREVSSFHGSKPSDVMHRVQLGVTQSVGIPTHADDVMFPRRLQVS